MPFYYNMTCNLLLWAKMTEWGIRKVFNLKTTETVEYLKNKRESY